MDLETIMIEKTCEVLLGKGLSKLINYIETTKAKVLGKYRETETDEEFEDFQRNFHISPSEDIIASNFQRNIKSSLKWSEEVNFGISLSAKSIRKIFIDLDLYLSPLKYRSDIDEKVDKVDAMRNLKSFNKNKIIYGSPGAGKSTLVKKFYIDYWKEDGEINKKFTLPLMIRFRELDYNDILKNDYNLFDILLNSIGIKVKVPEYLRKKDNDISKNIVVDFVNQFKILLIFDGFDEIPDYNLKKKIELNFQELSLNLENSRFLLTSRTNDFVLVLNNTEAYEICPLNEKQIKKITNKWIKNKEQANDFYEKIKKSRFFDTAIRPLALSHLCAIYERRKSIPSRPIDVYDLIISLLLENWDIERGIIRASLYSDFYIEKKKKFLSHLSFWLSYERQKNYFTEQDLYECYNLICMEHNLPKYQMKSVVAELESHTGLVMQTGVKIFEFSHKSLQEFLTAKYLSTTPGYPDCSILKYLPSETAIAIVLSNSPNSYLSYLNSNFSIFNSRFWAVFLERLIEEKPDFNYDIYAIAFFLEHIYENTDDMFYSTFMNLLETTNLGVAFEIINQEFEYKRLYESAITYVPKPNEYIAKYGIMELNMSRSLFYKLVDKYKLKEKAMFDDREYKE